jgi:hypothetical protein
MTPRRFVLAALSLIVALSISTAAAMPAFAAGVEEAAAPPAAEWADAAPLFDEGPLFTPVPKPMAPECHYCSSTFTTSPGGGAASHWGHGATCTDAQNDVRAQLSTFVNDLCSGLGDYGRCAFAVVYTSACYESGGQWVIDAYANFRCWVNYC